MPRNRYTQLSSLKVGNSDCRIKVRVVRYWKRVTKLGVVFKSFNIILLDNMKFQVQRYKIYDKFRCLSSDVQLIFSSETRIKTIDDDENNIENNTFDFYDHSELYELSKQTTYLADVVGIIKQYEPLATLVNKHGDAQRQEMNELKEKPAILIIASSRVGLWNGEVDLLSIGGTQCYLNYDHYSVVQLRRKLDQVGFKEQMYAADRHGKVELLSAATIKELGPEYIMRQVCAHLHIKYMEEIGSWYTTVCTGCGDEQIRTLLGIRVVQLLKQSTEKEDFPLVFKSVTKQKYTVTLLIKEINVVNKATIYWVTNICKGFIDPNSHLEQPHDSDCRLTSQASGSSYHLDRMSQLKFQSPASNKMSLQ
ncbi:hypothetical protein AgCh_012318 [Apium graveolens]